MDEDKDPLRRPIGWWLKHVDGLLDLGFEATLGAQDVSRRQWQILNGLAEGTPAAELLDSLTVFGDDDGVHDALAGLALRGWIRTEPDGNALTETETETETESAAGPVTITDAGRAQHRLLSEEVRAMRTSVSDGLSPEDYQAVVSGLARMAENLERRLAT